MLDEESNMIFSFFDVVTVDGVRDGSPLCADEVAIGLREPVVHNCKVKGENVCFISLVVVLQFSSMVQDVERVAAAKNYRKNYRRYQSYYGAREM